jgi:hypothetical protein
MHHRPMPKKWRKGKQEILRSSEFSEFSTGAALRGFGDN